MEPPTDESSKTDQPKLELVLREWIAAISLFHLCYNQLINSINTYTIQQQADGTARCIGQCPIDQMTVLLIKMQKEVEKLLLDMDQIDQPVTAWKGKKLIAHTRLLNRLNRQAQIVFQLVLQSAS